MERDRDGGARGPSDGAEAASAAAPRPSGRRGLRGEPRLELPGGELESVLRRLIREIADRIPIAPGEPPIVVDIEVDELRCVVLLEAAVGLHVTLSPREQEIARMVGQGYPNKTIAATLGISSWTVSTHLRRMFAKLGVRTRAALVARLLEEELVLDERRVFSNAFAEESAESPAGKE